MNRYRHVLFALFVVPAASLWSRADIVLSGCADISRPGRYTLDRNITGTIGSACLRIHDAADVHLDCAGHSITTDAEGLAAVVIATVKNFTVKACSLPQLSGYSLFVGNSSDGMITGNSIKNMVVNEPESVGPAALRVIGNYFSDFEKAGLDAPLSGQSYTGVIPLEPGVNWIEAKWMTVPEALDTPTGIPVAPGSPEPRVFPNPWRADRHRDAPVTFDRLSPNSTVKIYTVSAHWVKTLQPAGPRAEWDLRQDTGQNVASGIYLYLITDDHGNKVSGKLTVIR